MQKRFQPRLLIGALVAFNSIKIRQNKPSEGVIVGIVFTKDKVFYNIEDSILGAVIENVPSNQVKNKELEDDGIEPYETSEDKNETAEGSGFEKEDKNEISSFSNGNSETVISDKEEIKDVNLAETETGNKETTSTTGINAGSGD